MKSTMIAAAAAIGLLAVAPAGAQTSVTTTTTETTGSITIAPEKRTIIRERLSTAEPVTVKEKVTVGWTVPDTVELETVPDTIVSDIPTVKGYSYFVYNDDVVLVDPKTRKVVTIVE
ncbi:DUF1236 domain-containing protein [Microvirga makkahensis]|uniref:DUF1236 domain-containing protein n=1 Tax=Microvirga makkahensis TaxID=1128670 RepID=A0A7X3MSQ2_9HYPH|nr:DUF1236 domain-containing protein [Microvirga makkahensis]MXQ12451.1 DUF1236 domain-containing protein [Microvirga makkahensis]